VSDTAEYDHVDFGVLRRNPNEGGQRALMRAGFGTQRAFRMVEFEPSETFNLDRFEAQLKKPHGGYSWVVGNRGSGKSEIIAHLIRKQLSEQGGSRKPRLPLYISIAKGGTGDLDFERINLRCRESLTEAVQYLHLEGAKNPEHYKALRRILSNEGFRTTLLHDLQNTHHIMDGVPRETSLTNIMEAISRSPAANVFRVTLYIDDLDKVNPETASRFLSTHQQDLENLIGVGVRVIFSVSRDFMTGARDDLGLSFCGLHQWSHKPQEIIQVPDLSELSSAEVLQLIKRRFHYMHFDEDGGSWVSDFREKPHVNLSDVLEDPNWSTYDIRDMRRNSAITTLLSWLSRRKLTYTRDALKTIERILNSCPPESAKRQLQSRQIENYLKKHDVEESKAFLKEVSKRIEGLPTKKLKAERGYLSERSWRKAREATNQVITLGAWDRGVGAETPAKTLKEAFGLKTHKDKNSAIMKFLHLVVEMSNEESVQKILPNVNARTPDDLFSLIRHSQMDHILDQEIISQGASAPTEVQEIEASKKYGKILDDILWTLREEWKIEFETMQIEPLEERQLGDDLALELVYSIMQYPKRPNRGHKDWKDIEDIQKDGLAARAQFRRTLIQYLALHMDPESAEETAFVFALTQALSGNMSLQFLGSPRWGASADLFENLISRSSPHFTKRWAENAAAKCNRDYPREDWEIEADVKGIRPPKLTHGTLKQDLKFSQPVTFRIKSTGRPQANEMLQMLTLLSKQSEVWPPPTMRMRLLTDSQGASFETKIIVTLPKETPELFFDSIPNLDESDSVPPLCSVPVSVSMKKSSGQFTETFQLVHMFVSISSFTINPWNMRVPNALDVDIGWSPATTKLRRVEEE